MAIRNIETNEYINIDKQTFSIDDGGRFVVLNWFPNEENRQLEKERLIEIRNFYEKIKVNLIDNLNSDEGLRILAQYFIDNADLLIYKYPNTEENPHLHEIIEYLKPLQEYGFNSIWFTNPILKNCKSIARIDEQESFENKKQKARMLRANANKTNEELEKNIEYNILKEWVKKTRGYTNIEDC